MVVSVPDQGLLPTPLPPSSPSLSGLLLLLQGALRAWIRGPPSFLSMPEASTHSPLPPRPLTLPTGPPCCMLTGVLSVALLALFLMLPGSRDSLGCQGAGCHMLEGT